MQRRRRPVAARRRRLIADFIDALDLDDVTLVGNDTGGAICQLVVDRRPERLGRLVLTNCDAFENFPPRLFKPLVVAARVPGALGPRCCSRCASARCGGCRSPTAG